MQKTNFYYLFVGLLILLFAVPLAENLHFSGTRLYIGAVYSLLLLIGIWSLRGAGLFFLLGMAFVVAGVILSAIAIASDSAIPQYGSVLSMVGFLLVAMAFALKQVLFGTDMDASRLIGAVCVFLMIGVIWAFAYTLLELISPGSFSGLTSAPQSGWHSGWLYFSFVTLTTLGYGDVLPLSPLARTITYLEAVVGQFYIAVLVAGLVSAYISEKRGP